MDHPVARDAKITIDEMPNVDVRLKLFERHLDEFPCEADDPMRCMLSSSIKRMCTVCQVKMIYFHTIYNWDAYHPEDGSKEGWGSFTE